MPLSLFIFVLASFIQNDVPYKPKEEFQLVLDYQFKQRTMGASSTTSGTSSTIDISETVSEHEKKQRSTGPLPYLIINLKLLKLGEHEAKVRIVNGSGKVVYNKKAEVGTVYKIDLGFTDDVKDWVTPHEYNIYLLSSEKKEVSRIHMFIQKDGEFFVNNEKRGKF
jgi:hypothetical protein